MRGMRLGVERSALLSVSAIVFATLLFGAGSVHAKEAESKGADSSAKQAQESSESPAEVETRSQAVMDEARVEALELLEEMSDFLAKQKSFEVQAEISFEVVQPRGLRLEFGNDAKVLLRRPNRLWMERRGREGDQRTFRYDGKQVSLMFERENAYVQVERDGSIDEMLDYVVDELGMPMPLSDLVDTKFYARVADRIGLAAVVGESRIAEKQCVHTVYRGKEVDFQIWIAAEGDPLPCRIVVTYKQRRGEPQFRAQFSDWKLGLKIPDEQFEFEPPKDAERLRVRAFSTKGEK